MPESPRSDLTSRDRLRKDFDATFFVEAGAGTGKTAAIVDRIVALVAAGQLKAPKLVAITFTEAAAAELRARVKEGLEVAAGDPTDKPEGRERCRRAAQELDQASIDTIHAFAGALLHMFPLEAGLPPDFRTLGEIEEDLEFAERFRRWFDELADNVQFRDTTRRLLLLGMTPDQIASVVWGIQQQYDLLTPETAWAIPAAPPVVPLAHELGQVLVEARAYLRYGPADHPFARALLGLRFATERLAAARTEDEALAALHAIEWIDLHEGRQTDWREVDGQNAGRLIKETLKEVRTAASIALQAHRQNAFCSLLPGIRDFVLGYSDERKRLGVSTFHDLLTWARNLLRDHPNVRRRAQARWERIFVDEFQDTDPLQAELAVYLAADPSAPILPDWRKIHLAPGKLCVVGDPKQSIYRFRRADIALYQFVQGQVGETLNLTRNFRSVPRIVSWVNHHFGLVMQRIEGAQPEYIALDPHIDETDQGVLFVGHEVDGTQREVWEAEAKAVAECARRAVEEGWLVSEARVGGRAFREARYRDVCVLIPSRTNLKRLERAFDVESVPYRLESGELIILTQEVRDLISCLRAIDDPSDQVALVAALRSPTYGCSDPELLRWVENGGRLSYERPGTGQEERVARSLVHLTEFHRRRQTISVAALIEEYVGSRMLVAAAFGQARPREMWRRYRYVIGRARAFASATRRTTLREFVDWMEGLERDQARDVAGSLVETDEDAVRVLTIHGAKGLEFPIVIMTGWGSKRNFRPPTAIADRLKGRLDVGIGDFATVDYQAASQHERALDEAESLRLTYVAATRARDHLILSLFRRANATDVHARWFALSLESFGQAARVDLAGPVERRTALSASSYGDSEREQEEAEAEWVRRRRAALQAVRGRQVQTATGLSKAGDTEQPAIQGEVIDYRRGRGSTSLGRAVHAVLQLIDLTTLDGLAEMARAHATAEGIPDKALEVAGLVRKAASSQPVRTAITSGRYWREVPVGARLDGSLLEGFIDLLYEDDGKLVVVDYKTDRLSPAELDVRMTTYRLQGAAYALLVEAATKREVQNVTFVFPATESVRQIDDLQQAKADARQALTTGAGSDSDGSI